MILLEPRDVLKDYIENTKEGKCITLNSNEFLLRVNHTSRTNNINTLFHFDPDLNGFQAITPLGKLSNNSQQSRDKVSRWFAENPRRELTYGLSREGVVEVRACRSFIPRRIKKELVSVFRDSLGRTAYFVDESLPGLLDYLTR